MALRFTYSARACDACGRPDHTAVWSRRTTAAITSGRVDVDIVVVVCDCGMAFVSPAPEQEQLDAYYRASYQNWSVPDYSVDRRLELIGRYASGGTFVELGANVRGQFAEALRTRFDRYLTLEPTSSVAADFETFDAIAPESANIVAHYFVLEHVRDVAGFLAACRSAVKPDGVMICEVPDLALYPVHADALLLHEHMNHFSVNSLARVAARAGFDLVEVSHESCSRSFGFAAVFRPCDPREPVLTDAPWERLHAMSSIRAGGAVGAAYDDSIRRAAHRLGAAAQEAAGGAVVWGANAVMLALLADLDRDVVEQLTLIDSSPAKQSYGGYRILTPAAAARQLESSRLLVICSDYVDEITQSANEVAGRVFGADDTLVLSPPRL